MPDAESWYVCNLSDRTCFDIGVGDISRDCADLIKIAISGYIRFEMFWNFGIDRLNEYGMWKVNQLFTFLQDIPTMSDYRLVKGEYCLFNGVFDLTIGDVTQMGSLYRNRSKALWEQTVSDKRS